MSSTLLGKVAFLTEAPAPAGLAPLLVRLSGAHALLAARADSTRRLSPAPVLRRGRSDCWGGVLSPERFALGGEPAGLPVCVASACLGVWRRGGWGREAAWWGGSGLWRAGSSAEGGTAGLWEFQLDGDAWNSADRAEAAAAGAESRRDRGEAATWAGRGWPGTCGG